MTKLGEKAIALLLAASTLQPPHFPEEKDLTIDELSPELQAHALTRSVAMLTLWRQHKIAPHNFMSTLMRVKADGLPLENTEVLLTEVADHMYREDLVGYPEPIDRFMYTIGPRQYTPKQQEGIALKETWDRMKMATNNLAYLHPTWSFSRIFLAAVDEVKPDRVVQAAKWKTFDYELLDTMEHSPIPTDYAFPLFQPEEALAGRRTATLADRRFWSLHHLERTIMHTPMMRKRIRAAAKTAHLPPEELQLVAGSYALPGETTPTTRELRKERREQTPFAYDVQKMVFGLLPYCSRLHHDIDAILFVDGNARALGKVFEYFLQEFDLSVPVGYVKGCAKEKLVEAYGRTAAANMSGEERTLLAHNEQRREQDALILEDIAAAQTVYDRLAPEAFLHQLRALAPRLQPFAGRRVLVVDDWVKSGGTLENVNDLLRASDISVAETVTIIATPAKSSHSLLHDCVAMSADYLDDLTWRNNLPWYNSRCTGVRYGIDAQTSDPNKLFRLERDLHGYTMALPKDDFYSFVEMGAIAAAVVNSIGLDVTSSAAQTLSQQVERILHEYRVKESYVGTTQRVNVARVAGFYAGLREGVHDLATALKEEYGADVVRNYLRGDIGLAEAPLEALVQGENALLRAS